MPTFDWAAFERDFRSYADREPQRDTAGQS